MMRHPQMILAACCMLISSPVQGQRPKVISQALEFTSAFEAAARSMAGAQEFTIRFGDDVGPARAEKLLKDVRAYAKRAPDDGEVAILIVRLDRVRAGLALQEDPLGASRDTTSAAGHLAAVARVLERDPRSALAHHWKARLLVEGPVLDPMAFPIWLPWPVRAGDSAGWDTGEMLEHAREAVALDSANALYREFLAIQLALADRFTEAVEVARPLGPGARNLQRMLADFAVLGLPEGATANWPEHVQRLSFAVMWAADAGNLAYLDWAEVRYRVWNVPASIEDVEEFYVKRWPGVAFRSSDVREGARDAMYQVTPEGLVSRPERSATAGAPGSDEEEVSLSLRVADDGGPTTATVIEVMNLRRGSWKPMR